MYVRPNFKTKKALKEAVARGDQVEVFSPGPWPAKTDGVESVEGPHSPALHTWYASVQVRDNLVTKVLS